MLISRNIFLLFLAHQCAGQFFGPIEPFPPVPPPQFIMFYTFPPVTLQARLGGGLRASIPDDCGIESFEFESRKNATDKWDGGNVTSKTEGNWIFEDPSVLLLPGEALFYRCRIKQQGTFIDHPEAEWVVPDDLPKEFDPPKSPKKAEECPEDPTTPKPEDKMKKTTPKPEDKKKKTTPKPDDRKEETTAKPDEEESTGNPEEESTDEPEKDKKKPEKKKTPEKMKTEKPEEEKEPEENEPKAPECPAPGPKPGETREEALERKLWKVQCDMIQLAERSFKLNEALSFELTELKKLNYVVVTRIQRLESLLRNLNRPVPFPSPYY